MKNEIDIKDIGEYINGGYCDDQSAFFAVLYNPETKNIYTPGLESSSTYSERPDDIYEVGYIECHSVEAEAKENLEGEEETQKALQNEIEDIIDIIILNIISRINAKNFSTYDRYSYENN